jgi:hypothetical protein
MFREILSFPDFRLVPLAGLVSANGFFSSAFFFKVRVSVLFLHEMHEMRHIDKTITSETCRLFARLIDRNAPVSNMNPLKNIIISKKGYSTKRIAQPFQL